MAGDISVVQGEREAYWMGNGFIDIKLGADRTGGAFTLIEIVNLPGGGIGPHVHARDDETVMQVVGTLSGVIDGVDHVLHPGDVAFVPRGIVHSFTNNSSDTTRTFAITSPGGAESLVRETGIPKHGDTPPALDPAAVDWAAIAASAAKVGFTFLPEES